MSVKLDSSELVLNIKKMVAKKVFSHEDQDDIVQNIMLKIIKYADLREPGSFYAWLKLAVRSSIADYYRREPSGEEYLKDINTMQNQQNEDEDDDRDLTNCIRPFLEKMKKEESELILKVDLEGVSQKKLSTDLGLNYSTLKSRTTKARKRLGTLISECCSAKGNHKNTCC